METYRYKNRKDAGQKLVQYLRQYQDAENTLVLALPRGGVPVAYEISSTLNLPLDVYIVRKLGVPWHSELAMGALAPNHVTYLNKNLMKRLQISKTAINEVIAREQRELERRDAVYRAGKNELMIENKTIILVDDGIATGATMFAAIKSIRAQHPLKIVCASPVAAPETILEIKNQVEEIICPLQPEDLDAVGLWYEEFPQTTDEEVLTFLSTK